MGKIKQFIESDRGRDIMVILVVILVGLSSFELGRLSKGTEDGGLEIKYGTNGQATALEGLNNAPGASINDIDITAPKTATAATKPTVAPTSGNFFASKRGSKYYPANCAAGKNLKVENRIYFTTRSEAEAAGYELSGSCR